jgi:hypothetical protein
MHPADEVFIKLSAAIEAGKGADVLLPLLNELRRHVHDVAVLGAATIDDALAQLRFRDQVLTNIDALREKQREVIELQARRIKELESVLIARN